MKSSHSEGDRLEYNKGGLRNQIVLLTFIIFCDAIFAKALSIRFEALKSELSEGDVFVFYLKRCNTLS